MPSTPAVDHVEAPPPSASPTVAVGGPSPAVGDGMEVDAPDTSRAPDDELGDEGDIRKREAEELASLVHPDLKADVGANATGVYELVGKPYSSSGLDVNWSQRVHIQGWSPTRAPVQIPGTISALLEPM